MSYPNLPKSEYFQVFLAFQSCKASALLRHQHKKSNENLSLYRSKIFYRTDFWSNKAKTERILHGFASILTKSERKSVYKKHGSDNSFHPNGITSETTLELFRSNFTIFADVEHRFRESLLLSVNSYSVKFNLYCVCIAICSCDFGHHI